MYSPCRTKEGRGDLREEADVTSARATTRAAALETRPGMLTG